MDKQLHHYKEHEFSLVELVNISQSLIERMTPPPSDGRVAPIPDARTVRYYQTIGIISKPSRYDGRNAVYGYLHLLQLIVIKLLQAEGLSLAQIQGVLVQATQDELEKQVMATFTAIDKDTRVAEDQILHPLSSPPLSMGKIDKEVLHTDGELRRSLEMPVYEKPERKGKNLIAVEIAAGISVLIDPEKVSDPEGILTSIMKLLNHQNGEKK